MLNKILILSQVHASTCEGSASPAVTRKVRNATAPSQRAANGDTHQTSVSLDSSANNIHSQAEIQDVQVIRSNPTKMRLV